MKRHSLPVGMLLCGVLFMSCEKEEVAANTTAYGVHYQITTANPYSILATTSLAVNNSAARTATTVSWASGAAVARRIRFQGSGDNEVDIRITNPVNIDMTAKVTDLGMLSIPPGNYENARFTIDLSDTQPFELTGEYNGLPLKLQITGPLSFELIQRTLSISANTNYSALTTLNLSKLMNGITASLMAEAVVSNGQILISPTSNQRLYNLILANMKDLGELTFAKK